MTTPRLHLPSRHTVAVALATLAALAVALSAFARSFSALSDLAVMHEWPAGEAWILPVALDGMIVVPTVAAVVRRDARWYAWSLLVAGTVLSCAGNGVHAWLTTASQIAVALAVIPPLVTFFAVHLAIVVARQDRDTSAVAAPVVEPGPTVASDDNDKTIRDTDRDETPRPVTRLRVAPATDPRPAATPRVAKPRAATQQALALDVAPAATDDELRARAVHRVVSEGWTVRATGADLGVSKDKVQRWVTAHRAMLDAETVAV
ncbi:DUF2637 domain-containing protein [Rhodococcus sp. HM1]|uniref:DUF2637 domain-containing protein n=1 Tax=Rhodococcus sp. HM1 TaxID=2937759 RepID=UPI00200B55E9|nr:DUF2637 domain-containing protein [Rhodococcus sp. HM1]MCK8675015.1 DUF2637 domain-containing protein [Rhodococcus sp. HM1]